MLNKRVTPRQKLFIEDICEVLNIEFYGEDIFEADEFIKEHLHEYNKKRNRERWED